MIWWAIDSAVGWAVTESESAAAVGAENDQNEKQAKADCRHDQEVHRADARRMVVQKVFQVCEDPRPPLAMYLATVD